MGRCWFGVDLLRILTDEMWLHRLREVSGSSAIPLVAAGDVHFHVRSRKALQDVLTATRIGKPLTECGLDLQPNAERHLRTRLRLAQTYPEDLLAETLNVASRCVFSLDELRYQYPDEVIPKGETAASYLRKITYEGAGRRWPKGMPAKVQSQIEHELELISDLKYEHYFLTVADIVQFARSRHILCQGRGSAANSVVCYCIGVTEVDPARMSVLFERFTSKERNGPPDIDIDFEHERREEVLQYLYEKYGRDRAALTGVVISYRPKSAIRDVGKALGFSLETVDAIAKGHVWWDGKDVKQERLLELGLSVDDLQVRQLLQLTQQLLGFPRHLSQHTGGFVLTKGPLSRMVPIENASMKDRTVLQWDKDDLDALGLLARLESPRHWPRLDRSGSGATLQLMSTGRLADAAGQDAEFMQIALLYAGHADFDLNQLVADLVSAESVPFLPSLRYSDSGLRKRAQWEDTWTLQRRGGAGEAVGKIPVPPKYAGKDFLKTEFWRLRGSLDVVKERWVSYPGCERGADGSRWTRSA